MKLYTEEQVRLLLDLAKLKLNGEMYSKDVLLEQVAPIEIPSDEEIDKAANTQSHYMGAMWLKYKILNQTKGDMCYAFISQIDGKNKKCLKCGKDMFEHYNQNK